MPAAALAGRLLAEGGELRKANRIIDSAWRANPHPELAQSYAELRSGECRARPAQADRSAGKTRPGHVEGALAVARAAIDAREFAKARAALAPYLARADQTHRNIDGRARARGSATTRAAPANGWDARSMPRPIRHGPPTATSPTTGCRLSPVTGRIDAFEWRVPLTAMTSAAPVIESETVLVIPAKPAADTAVHEPHDGDPPLATNGHAAPLHPGLQPGQPKADPVIPLVHAPDDPGPEAEVVEETEAEPDAKPSGWRKIFE